MLATLVIGLREGLEASLIVGIVAAFLRKNGRTDLLRWVFLGIAAALTLCAAAGIALDLVSRDLPQRQQEGLETVIGGCAVAMVTYMVIWMKRHSRDLKGQLDRAAGSALAAGSGWALVAMAFLAVLREGLETAVFLLAAFNESTSDATAGIGAVLGVLIAVVLGWGIYRGGVRLNLSKFFRATGVVLVLVAAGLVLTALHTAHEAGWINVGQQRTVDLSWLLHPGTVETSVLIGVLGLQPRPVLIELVGWLLYLVPMTVYVAWPPGRSVSRTRLRGLALVGAAMLAIVSVILIVVRPAAAPASSPVTRDGAFSAQLRSSSDDQAVIRSGVPEPATAGTSGTGTSGPGTSASDLTSAVAAAAAPQDITVRRVDSRVLDGVPVHDYRSVRSIPVTGRPATVPATTLATLNGGRLPLGLRAGTGSIAVQYTASDTMTFTVAAATGRVVDVRWQETVTVLARSSFGVVPVASRTASSRLDQAVASAALRSAAADQRAADRRHRFEVLAVVTGLGAMILLLIALLLAVTGRGRAGRVRPVVNGSVSTSASIPVELAHAPRS